MEGEAESPMEGKEKKQTERERRHIERQSKRELNGARHKQTDGQIHSIKVSGPRGYPPTG